MIGCSWFVFIWETGFYDTAARRVRLLRVERPRLLDRRVGAEQRREEKGRRPEEGNPECRQVRRRCGGWTARVERSRPQMAARGRIEGAGEQGVRALHRLARPDQDERRPRRLLLAGGREGR